MITNGITTYRDKHSLYAPVLVLALTAELHQMHFVHRGGRRNTRIQSGILWNRKEGFTIFLTSLSDVVIGKSQGEYARVAGFKVCRSPKFTLSHRGEPRWPRLRGRVSVREGGAGRQAGRASESQAGREQHQQAENTDTARR